MKVTIEPEMQQFIEELIRSGRFSTASQAVNVGLAVLKMTDQLRETSLALLEDSPSWERNRSR